MQINVNHQSTNDNHNYDNRRSYSNLPLNPGECLVPIRVDWEMVKHFNMCQDNLETWHIGPNKVLVAFAPVKIENKPAALKQFNTDVREHFASFKSDDVLSLDQFMDEATSEDSKGFEPASPENLEETVMLRMIIQDLLKKIHEINPKHAPLFRYILYFSQPQTAHGAVPSPPENASEASSFPSP